MTYILQYIFQSRGSSRGPRIKHVCRRAAVALGQPAATFPDLTLSALPVDDKVKALQGMLINVRKCVVFVQAQKLKLKIEAS